MIRLYLDCFTISLCLLGIYHVAGFNFTPYDVLTEDCVTPECQYGVLDRFNEHGQAVILLESVGKEVHVERLFLPSDSQAGTWFQVTQDKKGYHLTIDAQKTWLEEGKVAILNYLLRQKEVRHSLR